MGSAPPGPQAARERERVPRVSGRLVETPGLPARHAGKQRDETRPSIEGAPAEVLEGAPDERQRLIEAVGQGIGGAQGRGDKRCQDRDLPRPADIEASLQDRRRARRLTATEVGEAQIEQAEAQAERMIDDLRDAHGLLGVRDRLVEAAELRENVGHVGPSQYRWGGALTRRV